MNIYLAGGFHSGWQDKVKSSVDANYYDPRLKEPKTNSLNEIATWDFYKIKQADIIFANMEKTNPSGFGLAVEIGFAKGLNKTVILVLEKNHETQKDRYLEFLMKAADITYETLDEAINFLKTF
jgi:nucleoside 2-deoxyribosyltransferase